ncbi:kynureninase [Kordiimonas pumila]|uniref:Kynureninase n=1 Tax=Kordiimonas pumila TaxID=2161677 RepID=A0ABV7D0H2_9PROT|nr:kynureninase [Kordiimonas pumila]
MPTISDIALERLDTTDPLRHKRAEFSLPDGVIYLDGNSLGVLPSAVKQRVQKTVEEEWGVSLIRGWNKHEWIDLPITVGNKIARLIGAEAGSVLAADSTSLNVAKAVFAAFSLNPERRVILSDSGNFPTDLYITQSVVAQMGEGYSLKIVAPDEVYDAIDETIAATLITEVDYRTGRKHDMAALTARAHDAGAIAVWDLCHSAGALEIDLTGVGADLAVGCSYKYLNGGPGSPAFIYVAPKHQKQVKPVLTGWMGHEKPFAFDLAYIPAEGIRRMAAGTPPVLALSALDAALDAWADVDMRQVREKSIALSELFIAEVEERCVGLGLELVSPRNAAERGSQISFRCADGYAVMQALIAHGVIGDFRAPDIIRFGFTPLYVGYHDVAKAAETLEMILKTKEWCKPIYRVQEKVT